MNKIGTLDIIKAYLGNKELSANNAYIGEISLIKGSGPTPVPVPNDEIWYTSTDGNVVAPYDTTALPTIVSNTYSDGKGIIKFATDVTNIGEDAFSDCSSLTSVTIPNSVTSIGNGAFSIANSRLASVYIYDMAAWCAISFGGVTANPLYYAHNLYLNETLVTDLVIPNSVTSIGDYAFGGCSSLTSVTIPNSVTSIGRLAFTTCTGLTSVTIPNSITSIGKAAFESCRSLTSVTIGNSVTNIEENAFYGCSGLSSITIPDSVTSIGKYAFYKCTSLTSMTIGNSVTSIGDLAFEYCSSLVSIIVKNGNTTFDSRNNCNAIIETSTNIIVFGCKNTTIPNSVVSIGNRAFANCDSLTTITIPNSVTSIGESAFNATGLTSITIPNSVTSIGNYAFVNCKDLTSIAIPNSVTSIGNNAFGQISAKILFSKLYSTYTNKIFSTPFNNTTYTYNVEFNISEIPTDYNISSMLPRHTGNKGTITYNIYTDYEPCKVQALALANTKTIVNVYHIDGTSWT